MSAFLLLAMPLFSLAYLSYFVPAELVAKAVRSFLKGILAFLPALLIWLILRAALMSAQGSIAIYLKYYLVDGLVFPAAAAGGYALFYRYHEFPETRRLKLTAFFSGVYCLSGLVSVITDGNTPDPYTLFFLPFIRIGTVALLPILVDKALDEYGYIRVLFFLAAPAFGLASALAGYFLDYKYLLPAIAVQVSCTSLALSIFIVSGLRGRRRAEISASGEDGTSP